MITKPYIGVTGITHPDQTNRIVRSLTRSDYVLMAGILVSSKTLAGIPSTRFPERYPMKVRHIVEGTQSERVLKIIHYNGPNDPASFSADLTYMHNSWGTNRYGIHGYQFNMVWPSVEVLARYKDVMSEKIIIVQAGEEALRVVNNDPRAMVKRLSTYPYGVVDVVLIDPSGGKGKPFNPGFVAPFVKAIAESDLNLSVAIAGGLGPNSVQNLERLIELCDGYRFSIDAEGRLRDDVDRLVVSKAQKYLRLTQKLLPGPAAL